MLQGTYYKEWSRALDREMEFKVYGTGGVPVLALPARGGRFYDWENNSMPDAASALINSGRLQLFCADSIDGESLLNTGLAVRGRAQMQERYFCYLTNELAARILELNSADERGSKSEQTGILCVGVDMGAYHAVNCFLRRPEIFSGAVGLSGVYDMSRFFGADSTGDDLILRNSPMLYLGEDELVNKASAAKGDLVLYSGQGAYEDEALADTKALSEAIEAAGLSARTELWGGDVSHDWYWWGKQWSMFAEQLVKG